MGALASFVKEVVAELDTTDLTNDEKRADAFQRIKSKAKESGKDLKGRLINLAIESAVSLMKK